MKQAAQQFQNPNPYVCKKFSCEKLAVKEGGLCRECEIIETNQKRAALLVTPEYSEAFRSFIPRSPEGTETSSQIEETSNLTISELPTIEQTSFDVDNSDDDKWEGDNPLNSSFIQPLSNSIFGNPPTDIPTIPSLQSSVELPPKPTHTSLPPLDTRPQSGFIPIVYVKSPTLRRPFSIATETPSTATPITGSTESVVDPAFFPKLRTEPISLVRRDATLKKNKSGKEKQAEQGTNEVSLEEIDNYQIYSIEDKNIGETEQALEGILDFYNPETSKKIENEDENIRKRLTNSIYFGLEELEQLRQMLPDLDKEAEEGLETIAEEIELETQELTTEEENIRQSIYLEEEAVEGLQEIYQKEVNKSNFNPKKFFQGVKKGVDKVKETGQTVAQKVENSKGFQVANKAAGVVFNPTTANITKIVAGEVLRAMPGGFLVANAIEGTINAAGKIKERRDELRKVQEEAKQATEQRLLTETEEIVGLEVKGEIREVKSDLEIDTIENKLREEDKEDEKETFEYEEEGDDDYPQIIETLDSMNTDLKSIKKTIEGLSLRDNLFYERVMSIDARTTGFNNILVNGVNSYKQSNENLKDYLISEFKTINTKEGERFNAISECLTTISSGVLNPQANFNVGDENNDNSLPTLLTQPFDMKQTAYDIRDEVLTSKSEILAIKVQLDQQKEQLNKTD